MADNDKFGIKINVDTGNAAKKLKELSGEADKANGSLNDAAQATENFDSKLNKIGGDVESLNRKFSIAFNFEAVKLFFDIAQKAYKVVSNSAQEMVSLGNTAQGLFMSTNDLKAWETTFKSMGFDAKEADAALGSIQDRITGQILNPSIQVASVFSRLHINLRKTNGEFRESQDILGEFLEKTKKLPAQLAVALGSQIGISRDVIVKYRNDPSFLKTLNGQKSNQVVTSPEERAAQEMVKQQALLSANITKLENNAFMPLIKILNDMLPPITKVADILAKLVTWGTENPQKALGAANPLAGGVMGLATDLAKRAKASGVTPQSLIDWAQQKVENAKGAMVGYAMHRNAQDKYSYKLDAVGRRIPEAYGAYQIKPSTASEVMGYKVSPQMLMNDQFNKTVHDKYMMQLEKRYGSKEAALAAYNGDLSRYKKTGSTPYLDKIKSTISNYPGQMPSASQSSAVMNNIVNHNQTSNIESSTHIGTVNVHANNPNEFAAALRGSTTYLDRFSGANGRLA